jgi:hypothetical protein
MFFLPQNHAPVSAISTQVVESPLLLQGISVCEIKMNLG